MQCYSYSPYTFPQPGLSILDFAMKAARQNPEQRAWFKATLYPTHSICGQLPEVVAPQSTLTYQNQLVHIVTKKHLFAFVCMKNSLSHLELTNASWQ